VVVYKTDRAAARTAAVASATTTRLSARYGFRVRLRYRTALRGFAARLAPRQVRGLRRDPRVALVSRDRVLHASGRVAVASGEDVPTGVSRIGAVTGGSAHNASSAGIAVLDTGVDLDDPQIDVRGGTNCVNPGNEPNDNNGHGTFVAGVAAARNEGRGVVGVAPGTPVWAVKTLDSNGDGEISEVICGIDWVTANAHSLGIRVANMSLGGEGNRSACDADALHLAICESTAAGVTYVVAAGNDSRDFGDVPEEIPAVYPEVLAVTAVADGDGQPGGLSSPVSCPGVFGENDDLPYTASTWATRPEDAAHVIAAPGVCIRSAAPNGLTQVASGTSAAAPHVAGVVSLCAGELGGPTACSGMTPPEVIEQVRADAALRAPAVGDFFGDPGNPIGSRYFGYLVSGLDPGVRRLSGALAPAVPHSNPPDRKVSLRRLRVLKTQSLRKLRVAVTLNESGRASASAILRVPARKADGAVAFQLRSARVRLVPGRAATLRLRRPARRVREARQALAAVGTRTAQIEVRLSDNAGNVRVVKRKVHVRR
jgi:subtilisin family serine protease